MNRISAIEGITVICNEVAAEEEVASERVHVFE